MSGTIETAASADPASPAPHRGMRALVAEGAGGRPRLPRLAEVIDRLTAGLTVSFRTISRGNAEATRAEEPKPVRFADFMEAVRPGALIAVARIGTWRGACLVVIDGALADTALGLLLGGRVDPSSPVEPRDHTAIERAVLERLARDLIAADIARAFAPVINVDVTLDRVVSDPADAGIARPNAPGLAWTVALTIEGRESSIGFLLPYASVEPIRPLLAREPAGSGQDRDPTWHAHLAAELPHANVTLRAILERRRISAADALRWRVGSTLMLTHRQNEPVEIFCQDLLVLRARMADQDGRIALHIDERRLAEDWPA